MHECSQAYTCKSDGCCTFISKVHNLCTTGVTCADGSRRCGSIALKLSVIAVFWNLSLLMRSSLFSVGERLKCCYLFCFVISAQNIDVRTLGRFLTESGGSFLDTNIFMYF